MSESESKPLKIQVGPVYLQLPSDDVKSIELAQKALEFMLNFIKDQDSGASK